jgi:capsid assembly protease
MNLHPFAARFFDRPVAMHRPACDALALALQVDAEIVIGPDRDRPRQYGFFDGIAIIPIQGILAKDAPWWCDATSYDWIRAGFDCALLDPEVRAIAFDVNSPGGRVEGCFDLADHIYASRGTKPIWSILGESAFSAAYALASAADYITVPRTGGAGSIGVVSCHVDMSKALDAAGVKVTYIQFGEKKTDGAAEKPLSDDARNCVQADVNAMGELFVATVARNRGISPEKVKDTEAATFLGPASVSLGLCDEVMAPDAAFQALIKKLG